MLGSPLEPALSWWIQSSHEQGSLHILGLASGESARDILHEVSRPHWWHHYGLRADDMPPAMVYRDHVLFARDCPPPTSIRCWNRKSSPSSIVISNGMWLETSLTVPGILYGVDLGSARSLKAFEDRKDVPSTIDGRFPSAEASAESVRVRVRMCCGGATGSRSPPRIRVDGTL